MNLRGEVLESLHTIMVKIRRFDERTVELFTLRERGSNDDPREE